MSYTFM